MKTKEQIYEEYSNNPIEWMKKNKCMSTKEITLKLMEKYANAQYIDKLNELSVDNGVVKFIEKNISELNKSK